MVANVVYLNVLYALDLKQEIRNTVYSVVSQNQQVIKKHHPVADEFYLPRFQNDCKAYFLTDFGL